MSTYISKFDILLKINELQDNGNIQIAMRLQRIFLDSIKQDQRIGRYSSKIELDRQAKKVALEAGLTLMNINNKEQ